MNTRPSAIGPATRSAPRARASRRRPSSCAAARATCRRTSPRCCSAAPRRRIWSRYEPAELAALARDAWAFLASAQARRAEDPLRAPPASAGEHLKSISVIEIVNDDMPFLVDSVMGELTERGLDVRLVAHPVLAVERDARPASSRPPPAEAGSRKDAPRESFIHIHVDARRGRGAPRRDRAGAGAGAGRRARLRAGLAADARPGRRGHRRAQDQSAAAAGRRHRRGDPVPEWLLADNFTLLGVRDYALHREPTDARAGAETGLGMLRARDVPVLRRGGEVGDRSRRRSAPSSTSRRR